MADFSVSFNGVEALEKELNRLNSVRFDGVIEAQAANMVDRATATHNPIQGGTPYDTGELIQSVNKSGSSTETEIGYIKEYAPHVEYGHRQNPGQFVPAIGKRLKARYVEGQHFLRNNVNIQRDIYKKDLQEAIKKEGG